MLVMWSLPCMLLQCMCTDVETLFTLSHQTVLLLYLLEYCMVPNFRGAECLQFSQITPNIMKIKPTKHFGIVTYVHVVYCNPCFLVKCLCNQSPKKVRLENSALYSHCRVIQSLWMYAVNILHTCTLHAHIHVHVEVSCRYTV